MTSYGDVTHRWVEHIQTPRDPRNHRRPARDHEFPRELKTQRVFYRDDTIFSYGSHFPMADVVRDKKGYPTLIVVNGDTFSSSTSGHQSHVRSSVQGSWIPHVIIPFSVLDAAGIDRSTIEALDVTADRIETRRVVYREVQGSWVWHTRENFEYREPNEAETAERLAKCNAEHRQKWLDSLEAAMRDQEQFYRSITVQSWQRPYTERWAASGVSMFPPPDLTFDEAAETWHWMHRLHESVQVPTGETRHLYTSHRLRNEVEIGEDEDGPTYTVTISRHWLGESLIRAQVPSRRRVKCRTCGGFGTLPLGGPEIDKTTRYDLNYPNGHVIDTRCPTCDPYHRNYDRGTGKVWRSYARTAVFLSGFDHNESRPSYFFNEMPSTKSRTVAEAYNELMPDTVKMAVQMGRAVYRQGDIFAVPVPSLTKRAMTKAGATYERRGNLLGTNHEGTEVAFLDGLTYVRGTLTHNPQWRRPDHARVSLPKGVWHLVLKNTVPLQRAA